jgi:hypothetical protein
MIETRHRMPAALIVLALICSASFGAIVAVALADDYHTTCVGHGFVNGGSNSDGSFFGRVEPGCGSTNRICPLYTYGSQIGYASVGGTTLTCNNWSRDYGDYTECASTTHTNNPGVFSDHVHKSSNWCG